MRPSSSGGKLRHVRCLGIDLAWKEGPNAPETGVIALEPDGTVANAGWTLGIDATAQWVERWAEDDTLVFVDAPLWVDNATGQRACERAVGQCYWRWKVSANSTNLASVRLGGVALLRALERDGFRYDDGLDGPPSAGRWVSECYPYTTICGVDALQYDERPRYKRKPKSHRIAGFRPLRAAACDDLIERVARLDHADPPLHLRTHPATGDLLDQPSPLDDRSYKHREDLLDAVLCAWTAQLWLRHGATAVQALRDPLALTRPQATILAPYRQTQLQEPAE